MYHDEIGIKKLFFGKHVIDYNDEPDLKRIIKAEVDAKISEWGVNVWMLVTGKMQMLSLI